MNSRSLLRIHIAIRGQLFPRRQSVTVFSLLLRSCCWPRQTAALFRHTHERRPGATQTKSAPRHKRSNSEVERLLLKMEDEWVMSPREPYEIIGDVGYVVFLCGQVVDEATGDIRLFMALPIHHLLWHMATSTKCSTG